MKEFRFSFLACLNAAMHCAVTYYAIQKAMQVH